MRVEDIQRSFPEFEISGNPNVEIKGIANDSREVKKGDIFVAIRGERFDSHTKIEEAIKKGAVGIVCEREVPCPAGLLKMQVPDSREAYALLSSLFWDFPSRSIKVVGITGTSGKTTTAFLLYKLFNFAGIPSGFLGTIGSDVGNGFERSESLPPTTPEAFLMNSKLFKVKENHLSYAFLEVTSHALKQKRVAGIKFFRKLLTNIQEEHIDFHGTLDDYVNTKLSFFFNENQAVLNADSLFIDRFKAACNSYTLFGIEKDALIRASNIIEEWDSSTFILNEGHRDFLINLKLPAIYNIYNFLGASTIALQEGISIDSISSFAKEVPEIPGRMNCYEHKGKRIVIDFAHNPFEVKSALSFMRRHVQGRLITILGAVGLSTEKKCMEMGEVASLFSDFVIVTTDDPRGDDPERIASNVFKGIKGEGKVVVDREKAILEGLRMLKEGDLLAILGRGDEQVMHYKNGEVYLDDFIFAREMLDGI